jgi:hypothetical protein
MPMAKKLGAPIFLKKSEKYSTVSIKFILSKDGSLRKVYMLENLLAWTKRSA